MVRVRAVHLAELQEERDYYYYYYTTTTTTVDLAELQEERGRRPTGQHCGVDHEHRSEVHVLLSRARLNTCE